MLDREERQTEMEGSRQRFLLLTTCFRQLLAKEVPKVCNKAQKSKKKVTSMNCRHSVLKE